MGTSTDWTESRVKKEKKKMLTLARDTAVSEDDLDCKVGSKLSVLARKKKPSRMFYCSLPCKTVTLYS